MAGALKAIYIVILILTVIFAIVEIGLASDLDWRFSRLFIGFRGFLRPRTRYLIFCSAWGILAGLILLIFLLVEEKWVWGVQVVVMFMSMMFWLIGAALFTSATGGGISCGSQYPSCLVVNIVNTTLAFAWINWAFVLIGFFLALCLVFSDSEPRGNTQNTTRTPANTQAENKGPQMPSTPAPTGTTGQPPAV